MNLKDLLDCTGKLGRFKQGPTASALRHQKELLNGLKAFIPWSQQLSERRQQILMETVVDTTAKIFKKIGQKLQLGPIVTIPRPNATAVSAGVIRKTFLAAGCVLKATEALVVDWDKEDEVDMLSEDEDEEEEHDSPPKQKRHVSFSSEPSTKQHSSPATSRRRAKALGRVRRAYRAALRIAKAVEEFPHAFGDEMEWSIRPSACPDIADQVTDDCEIATLDDLEDARDCAPASLEKYIAFFRGSAVIWHAHLCKCPEVNTDSLPDPRKENWLEEIPAGKALFREDAGPGAGEKVANNDSIGKQRGVLDAAAKAFNGDYFAANLVQHASFATGNLHKDPAGAKTTSKPKSSILFCFQWNAGKCTKKAYKFPHVCSSCGGDHRKKDNASIGFDRRGRNDRPTPVDLVDDTVQRGVSTSDIEEPALSSWGASSGLTPIRVDVAVAQGAGWQFDLAGVDMSGENYVKTGFEHKVDELHEEELRLKRVVPIPPHLAEAVHGVGVVDKDHSKFEKVRVIHNYSENDDWSVNSATDIPEQKWQSAADAMAFLRPRYYMIKACQGIVLVLWFGTRIAEVSKEMALDVGGCL
ncbi:hypothetical protein CYMTET_7582 [Cymbomonas tetramitiformis]|uniref:Uncharacterized protein n=1 Tax=Cymbomonas tetramitiformis TaxID=36881 RepID=A0AAE0GUR0_9CHLO|nr:hypothetical protein CYMTET_7582 [Cymbomonas tetramitiformis]